MGVPFWTALYAGRGTGGKPGREAVKYAMFAMSGEYEGIPLAIEVIHILGPGAKDLAATLSAGSNADWAFVGNDVAPEELSPEPPAAVLLTQDSLRKDPRIQRMVTEHPVSRRPGMLTTDGFQGALDPAMPHKFYPVLSDAIERAWIRHSLAQFADLGGIEFVQEMTDLFSVESDKHIATMEKSLATSDWATFGRIAHTLKSSFANYGARRMQRLAQMMESETAAGNTTDMRQHLETLTVGINRLKDLLISMATEK